MLPAPKPDGLSLADVMESCLASIEGGPNRLGLGRVDRAVVLLIDGLGADALKARAGHARTLLGALTGRSVIEAGFPTTTASALASLTTGVLPGSHGMVGYSVLDPEHDRVVNQLTGWDDKLDPLSWQLQPTLFERATARGFGAYAVGTERYRRSGFTSAVLRGAHYVSGATIAERMSHAIELVAAPGPPSLIYVYIPELDMAAHAHGWESREWTAALETTDSAVRALTLALGRSHGLLVTADHGILDVPARAHVLFNELPGLLDGVRFVAGEPRALQVHFEPDLATDEREQLTERWRASEEARAWVATRQEFIQSGWLGAQVSPEVVPRLGDLLVAARKTIAYYDSGTATRSSLAMIGQHGSATQSELRVPLLRFGAFARAA